MYRDLALDRRLLFSATQSAFTALVTNLIPAFPIPDPFIPNTDDRRILREAKWLKKYRYRFTVLISFSQQTGRCQPDSQVLRLRDRARVA